MISSMRKSLMLKKEQLTKNLKNLTYNFDWVFQLVKLQSNFRSGRTTNNANKNKKNNVC